MKFQCSSTENLEMSPHNSATLSGLAIKYLISAEIKTFYTKKTRPEGRVLVKAKLLLLLRLNVTSVFVINYTNVVGQYTTNVTVGVLDYSKTSYRQTVVLVVIAIY
jgi:hypothetical protein